MHVTARIVLQLNCSHFSQTEFIKNFCAGTNEHMRISELNGRNRCGKAKPPGLKHPTWKASFTGKASDRIPMRGRPTEVSRLQYFITLPGVRFRRNAVS